MARFPRLRCALTIAGSDSGGGAGVQADLRTFAALGVHGTSAITCLTAQNPRAVLAVEAASAAMVGAQLDALFAELPPDAAKTGMLFSARLIRGVAAHWRRSGTGIPLVVDPVMVATSGARLLEPAAIRVLTEELLPLATLLTPNLDEAALLVGAPLRTLAELRDAARALHARFGAAVLAKGGHLATPGEAVDVFFDGRREELLRARRISGVSTHGTGCTYSAAVAAGLARGLALRRAVRAAKEHITAAIAGSRRVGRHLVLGGPAAGFSLERKPAAR
ncbi:MAG: bifunctional hydroxymethylpyrimidine kinase/phosphomethylpyrimidine kinase [Limisphaerales bacterium]